MKNTERILWLDGIKGILCLLIFVHHFLLIFFPAIHYGGIAPSYLNGFDTYLSQSPISVIFNGNYMVALFCVISAVVLSRSIMTTENKEKLAGAVVKRYFRLMLPVVAIGFVTFIFSQLGLFTNVEVGEAVSSPSAVQSYREPMSFIDFIFSVLIRTWFYGDNTISPAYWMLSKLFIGSLVCMLISIFPWKFKRTSLIFYSILALAFLDRSDLILAFILGTMIGWATVYMKKLFNPYLGAAALIFGILLGGYPSGVEPTNFYRYINFMSYIDWHILGAAATIFGLFSLSFLQNFFSKRPFLWLGKISYSVYLVHMLVLYSLATSLYMWLAPSTGYYTAVAISFVASTAVMLTLSYLYQKYVETGCNKLQGKMFSYIEKIDNKLEEEEN